MELFYDAIKFLKTNFKLDKSVQVRRVALKNNLGTCNYCNEKFTIVIEKTLDERHAIDILIHEWAHAMTYNEDDDSWSEANMHNSKWGKKYAEIFRGYYQNILKNNK